MINFTFKNEQFREGDKFDVKKFEKGVTKIAIVFELIIQNLILDLV